MPILTFSNHASYTSDGHTATLQQPHFMYLNNKYTYWIFLDKLHNLWSPPNQKCCAFHNAIIFGTKNVHILHTGYAKF